jgi:hypothetical protein
MNNNLTIKTYTPATGDVRVWRQALVEGGPEVTMIRVPISSTSVDRDGDEFSQSGLQALKRDLDSGKVPLYLDHGYQPSGARLYAALDMVGAWVAGEIEGSTLFGTAFLEPENWIGDSLARKISAGLPIGFSVGFAATKSTPKQGGGYVFDDAELWEVSAVGIPSNPDAVNSAAVMAVVKSLRVKAGLEKDMTDTRKKKPEEDEEQEEEEKTTCEDEEEKAPETDEETDEEEEEEDEKRISLDEIRSIVADEVAKSIEPILTTLKSLDRFDEIKSLIEKQATSAAAPTRKPKPRGIVVAKSEPTDEKSGEPSEKQALTPKY